MKTKKHKTFQQKWTLWLDLLWRKIIHERDNHKCQWCGKEDSGCVYNAHHIFGRTNKSTRWATKNGILLCFFCHHYRIEKDHEGLRANNIARLGLKEYNKLWKRSQQPLYTIDYEMWERELIKELESLKVSIPKKPKIL